eukprot:CAMPEP_0181365820 /NCGR_PEP_ID=MMETSP1106-20121128/10319_1 /TAXON_ID=81844 /ORGANISM="Mantoniella antarctica, Strain SL-175" /LENGTH=196 /DNA_ID=CAMNT_0023481017 /DNA_START=262 /DNA_END=852 /DNA_ORIENTATION=+
MLLLSPQPLSSSLLPPSLVSAARPIANPTKVSVATADAATVATDAVVAAVAPPSASPPAAAASAVYIIFRRVALMIEEQQLAPKFCFVLLLGWSRHILRGYTCSAIGRDGNPRGDGRTFRKVIFKPGAPSRHCVLVCFWVCFDPEFEFGAHGLVPFGCQRAAGRRTTCRRLAAGGKHRREQNQPHPRPLCHKAVLV